MLPRAQAKNFSDARQQDNKEKFCKKILLLRLKTTKLIFLARILGCARAVRAKIFFEKFYFKPFLEDL